MKLDTVLCAKEKLEKTKEDLEIQHETRAQDADQLLMQERNQVNKAISSFTCNKLQLKDIQLNQFSMKVDENMHRKILLEPAIKKIKQNVSGRDKGMEFQVKQFLSLNLYRGAVFARGIKFPLWGPPIRIRLSWQLDSPPPPPPPPVWLGLKLLVTCFCVFFGYPVYTLVWNECGISKKVLFCIT